MNATAKPPNGKARARRDASIPAAWTTAATDGVCAHRQLDIRYSASACHHTAGSPLLDDVVLLPVLARNSGDPL